jgi:hypothetical protein
MTEHSHHTRRHRAAEHDPGPAQDITDPTTGGSRILSRKCDTCILRPGNLMRLGPGRLADLLARTLPRSYVVCHETLTYGVNPDYGPAICRGFADRYGDRSWAITLLRRCGRLVEVAPPGDDVTATDTRSRRDRHIG